MIIYVWPALRIMLSSGNGNHCWTIFSWSGSERYRNYWIVIPRRPEGLTARIIRINVLSFLESGEIIFWATLQGITNSKFTGVRTMCEPASHASHTSQYGEPCESTCEPCESHSYWKVTVLKWVLRLKSVCVLRKFWHHSSTNPCAPDNYAFQNEWYSEDKQYRWIFDDVIVYIFVSLTYGFADRMLQAIHKFTLNGKRTF